MSHQYVVQYQVSGEGDDDWFNEGQDFEFDPTDTNYEQAAWRAASAVKAFLDYEESKGSHGPTMVHRIAKRTIAETEM